jgi:hypothetical protein
MRPEQLVPRGTVASGLSSTGKWRACTVRDLKYDKSSPTEVSLLIHFNGFEAKYDEWVAPQRVKLPCGKTVTQVLAEAQAETPTKAKQEEARAAFANMAAKDTAASLLFAQESANVAEFNRHRGTDSSVADSTAQAWTVNPQGSPLPKEETPTKAQRAKVLAALAQAEVTPNTRVRLDKSIAAAGGGGKKKKNAQIRSGGGAAQGTSGDGISTEPDQTPFGHTDFSWVPPLGTTPVGHTDFSWQSPGGGISSAKSAKAPALVEARAKKRAQAKAAATAGVMASATAEPPAHVEPVVVMAPATAAQPVPALPVVGRDHSRVARAVVSSLR